jgi:hypothetical protein
MTETATSELRRHRRHAPTILAAEVHGNGKSTKGYLLNVSLGGAFLAIDEPPSPEETVSLHLLLPWGIGECALSARIAWVQRDERDRPIGAGLAFQDPTEEASRKLQRYLERFVDLEAQITN